MNLTEKERVVLTALQRGVVPVARPFRGMALPENDVVALLRRARAAGLVRRFGGVFDARRLGYRSVLCALEVGPQRMEEMAAVVVRHAGVTHCYERRPLSGAGEYPALWFTLALLRDEFDEGLAALRAQMGGARLLLLPALRRFKIDVVFDLRTRERDETLPGGAPGSETPPTPCRLSEEDRNLVRSLDQHVPVGARPFDDIARQIGMPAKDVLARLQRWKEQGVLRRIAAVLHHREAGFRVNGMCVWPVDGDAVAAGRRVAARPEVTHCYLRPRRPEFPFDLYAMIHAGSRQDIARLFDGISAEGGLSRGTMLVSLREFKKSSMKYFRDSVP